MTRTDLSQVATLREQVLFALVLLALNVFLIRVYSSHSIRIAEFNARLQGLAMEKETLIKYSVATPMVEKTASLSRRKGIKMKVLLGEVKPAHDHVAALLAQLSDPVFLQGILVRNLNYKPPVVEGDISKTGFFLNVQGNFQELIRYLERLEQFPALFQLENISLQSIEGQVQDVEAEINGVFFQYSVKKTVAGPETGRAGREMPGSRSASKVGGKQ